MTQYSNSRFFALIVLVTIAGWTGNLSARDLTEATFTQVVNDVNVSNGQGANRHSATVNGQFTAPEIVTTGANSRAELTAPDQTVTRVGANTVFSFKPEGRGINLQQGSVLFNSPHGRGGGVIQTRSATAAVLGTTIIVSATSNGGFKMLCLEGHGQVELSNGRIVPVNAGQLAFVLPGGTGVPPVFEFRISKLLQGKLTGGFTSTLPSQNKITDSVSHQEHQIATGNTHDTGLILGDVVGTNVQLIDPDTQQSFVNANSANFDQLASSDALINSQTLDGTRVIQFDSQFDSDISDVNDPNFGFFAFDVFLAHNLTISTSLIDLSPYGGDAGFVFFATGNMNITGSTSFNNSPDFVALISLGDLSVAAGSTLHFSAVDGAAVIGVNDMNFSNVSFVNDMGQMLLGSNSSITLAGGLVSGNSSSDDSVLIQAGSNFSANGTSFVAKGSGGINLQAVGTISLINGSFTSNSNITAATQGNMNIQGGTFSAGGNVNLNAGFGPGGQLSVLGTTFANASQISMQAYTLIIGNGTTFANGSTVNLYSYLGSIGGNNTPNFGSVQSGQVNFVGGSPSSVKYGSIPIGNSTTYTAFNGNPSNAGKVNILQGH